MKASRLKHVVVVGGGLAGLAAAESLVRHASVTVIEPSGRLGGMVATVRGGGWLVERSADSFLAARPEGIAMVERMGLSSELVGVNPRVRRALIYHAGRTIPVPAGFRLMAPGQVRSIVSTSMLSPLAKLRILAERFVPARHAASDEYDDETLEHFAVRRLGRQAFERLVQPLVAGIWTADPARLSMAAACPEFLEMERHCGSLWAGERSRLRGTKADQQATGARYGQFVTLASGMETLPIRLGKHLDQAGVSRITASATHLARRMDGGWDVSIEPPEALTRSHGSGGQVCQADGVVLAVSATAAATLLTTVDKPLADALAGIEYAGSAIVSLGFARSDVAHPLDAAGMVVPRGEHRRILAVSFLSEKFPGRAPPGFVLLRVFVGGALDPEASQLDDAQLTSMVMRELADMLGVRGDPRLVQIDRWSRAMPQYHVGHRQRIARIHERLLTIRGLALAGAAYEGVGIPQVIASGQAAAASLGCGERGE